MIRKQNDINKKIKQSERSRNIHNTTQEEDIDLGSFFELTTSNKKYFNRLNLHEIKNEISEDCTGDFEMIAFRLIGELEQKTYIRLGNFEDFETHNNSTDVEYDSENVVFTWWLYKSNTL